MHLKIKKYSGEKSPLTYNLLTNYRRSYEKLSAVYHLQ